MVRSVLITKRAMDIVISVVALVIFLIPMMIFSVLIMIESKGSPIYTQRRMKRHNRNSFSDLSSVDSGNFFNMYKLRTMIKDAEKLSGPVNASENDPRVTRIGRFLRGTRLDEVPNFINVLKGEMSVVGPRADRYEIQMALKDDFPLIFERLLEVKPGITGWAQLELKSDGSPSCMNDELLCIVPKEDRGKEVKSFRYKLYYESAYCMKMNNFWSFLKTDISIILRTPIVMFFRRNVI